MSLAKLPGLGAKSAQQLSAVGIESEQQLRELGAIAAFVRLQSLTPKPSLNFLYALVGALEGRRWQEVARTDKNRLLAELEQWHQQWGQACSSTR